MAATRSLATAIGIKPACAAFGLARSGFYRGQEPAPAPAPRPSPPRTLSPEERQAVLATLHSDRFVDHAPATIYATLLDEGRYYCSIRTLYRILAEQAEVRERRNQLRHPLYQKPELLATAPNQVWSWDITKLLGPVRWSYFYLYVILDIFSRYVVGWMLAPAESAALAQRLAHSSRRAVDQDRSGLRARMAVAAGDCALRRPHARRCADGVGSDNACIAIGEDAGAIVAQGSSLRVPAALIGEAGLAAIWADDAGLARALAAAALHQ